MLWLCNIDDDNALNWGDSDGNAYCNVGGRDIGIACEDRAVTPVKHSLLQWEDLVEGYRDVYAEEMPTVQACKYSKYYPSTYTKDRVHEPQDGFIFWGIAKTTIGDDVSRVGPTTENLLGSVGPVYFCSRTDDDVMNGSADSPYDADATKACQCAPYGWSGKDECEVVGPDTYVACSRACYEAIGGVDYFPSKLANGPQGNFFWFDARKAETDSDDDDPMGLVPVCKPEIGEVGAVTSGCGTTVKPWKFDKYRVQKNSCDSAATFEYQCTWEVGEPLGQSDFCEVDDGGTCTELNSIVQEEPVWMPGTDKQQMCDSTKLEDMRL